MITLFCTKHKTIIIMTPSVVIINGRYIVIGCIIWPILIVIVTYSTYFSLHANELDVVRNSLQIPTISETGQLVPESIILTYGLHAEAVGLCFLFVLIYLQFQIAIDSIREESQSQTQTLLHDDLGSSQNIHTNNNTMSIYDRISLCNCWNRQCQTKTSLTIWNKVLLWLGLLSALFMSLVGSISLAVDDTVHTIFAFLTFLTAALHCLIFYYTIMYKIQTNSIDLFLHTIVLIIIIPFNIIMIIIISVMWVYCTSQICINVTVNLIPTLEYITAIVLLVYIYRFYNIVTDTKLIVVSDSNSYSDSDNNVTVPAHIVTTR